MDKAYMHSQYGELAKMERKIQKPLFRNKMDKVESILRQQEAQI